MTIKPKKQNLKRLFIFNGLLLVVAFALIQYSVVNNTQMAISSELGVNPVVQGMFIERLTLFDNPKKIDDIEFKTAFDKDMSLDDLKGQWVVLNFWATWCPPCIVEMPSLQLLQDQYGGQGVKVVGISLDRNMNGKKLREFMKKYQFGPIAAYYGDWPIIRNQVEVKALPTTYILSPNGQAIGIYNGEADWVGEDANAFIESLIQ